MTYRNIKKVLGISIDDLSSKEALEKTELTDKPFIIVTPGPEFLLTAQKDKKFAKILNAADLALPDGFGLHLAGVKNRVPGVDFMLLLCAKATKNGWTIGLLGGRPGVAKKTARVLTANFPEIKIIFALDSRQLPGPVDLLFVAFGHPKQERLLWRLRRQFRVGMAVGGAFDYLSGVVPRAPAFVRALGLEWLWRFLTQPRRLRRIVSAVVVFPLKLLFY